MNSVDTVLVSFTTNPDGNDILIVARKLINGNPHIIKAIEGSEARELYMKLVGKGI